MSFVGNFGLRYFHNREFDQSIGDLQGIIADIEGFVKYFRIHLNFVWFCLFVIAAILRSLTLTVLKSVVNLRLNLLGIRLFGRWKKIEPNCVHLGLVVFYLFNE